jgi:hypothetical protein
MKPAHRELLIVVVCLVLGFFISKIVLHYAPPHGTRVINCSIAEFSPDFTTEMRQQCRKLRSNGSIKSSASTPNN